MVIMKQNSSILETSFSTVNQEIKQWKQDRDVKIVFWKCYQNYIYWLKDIYKNEKVFTERLKLKKRIYRLQREQKKFKVNSILCMDLGNGKKLVKRKNRK